MIVGACADGTVDPSPIGNDEFRRVRESWLLNAHEAKLFRELDEMVYLWHCSTAQLVSWDTDAKIFDFNFKKVKELYRSVGKGVMPWYDWEKSRVPTLQELWERFKAIQADPAEQAFVREFRAELEVDSNRMKLEDEARANALAAYDRIRQKRQRKRNG